MKWKHSDRKCSNARRSAYVSLGVQGRHNVAHRRNGEARGAILTAPEGRHDGSLCIALSGLGSLPSRGPTSRAAGYVASSLKELTKMMRALLRSAGQTPKSLKRISGS